MKNDTQKMLMYIALGAAVATLVLYLSGQLRFAEFLEGEEATEEELAKELMDGEPLPMGDSDSDSDSE